MSTKVHAVVAWSTFPTQNAKNTSTPQHFWKLRCWKKRTLLWREAHLEVKTCKTQHVRSTFGSWDVQKVHGIVAKSTFRSQKCKKLAASGHFLKFRRRKSAPRCGEKQMSKSNCYKHTTFVPLLAVHDTRHDTTRDIRDTRHENARTRDTRHETREHETRDMRHETRDTRHETRRTTHTTLDTRHTTRHLQPPVGPSVGSLCHPCITTIHLSYSALSLKFLPPPCAVLLVLELRRSLLSLANPNGKEECWRKMVRSTPLGQHATARSYVCFVFVFIPVRVVVRLRSCVCCMCVCAPVCADEGKRKKLHACISLAVFSFTESKSWKYHIGHCYRVGLLLSLLLV